MKTQPTMTQRKSLLTRVFLLFILAILSPASLVWAQTTTFTYQGRFTDGGTAANGVYDMQFKVFDSPSVGTGNQIASTITNGAVTVNSGVFTVQLDFGASGFSGADRFLEIGVRLSGDANPYTVLAPRQPLTSAVYAIRAGSTTNADIATNATQLGGVAADQYVQTNDSRLTDARSPSAGSSNYIQNSINAQAGDFNISGNGKADTFTTNNGYYVKSNPVLLFDSGSAIQPPTLKLGTGSATVELFKLTAANNVSANQYNIGGSRVLSIPGTNNTFVGINTGTANTNGQFNSFVGTSAGAANTVGHDNSFFGVNAGKTNNGGFDNSFFGVNAGSQNNTGDGNSFFGFGAGNFNTSGTSNSYFGKYAGFGSGAAGGVAESANSFFGAGAGFNNTAGGNSFFGNNAGQTNTIGSNDTVVGNSADLGSNNLSNATAIGANALVTQNNSLVLGSIAGLNSATADTNVGIGTTAPKAAFHVAAHGGNFLVGNPGCLSGFVGLGFASSLSNCSNFALMGNGTDLLMNTPAGGNISFGTSTANSTQYHMHISKNFVTINTVLSLNKLDSAGSTHLCLNSDGNVSGCSSSLRYKTNFAPYTKGFDIINRLRPITFDWKKGGMRDVGFGAEDVEQIDPLLVTYNDKGQVEGVKYDRISVALVNAVKEQQTQIEQQRTQLNEQQREIAALKRLMTGKYRRSASRKHVR